MSEQNLASEVSPRSLRNTIIFVVGLVVLGFVFALLLFGGDLLSSENEGAVVSDVSTSEFPAADSAANQIPNQSEIEGAIGIGTVAPDFALVDLEGNSVQLSDLRGQPVIINFWATWCAPCRIEMPELEEAFHTYADENLVILAVNREESPEVVADFFYDEMNLSFTPLLDSTAVVAGSYDVFNMPTTYFLNEAGEITIVHRGPMTAAQIDGYMEQTLQ